MIQAYITEGPFGDSLRIYIIDRQEYGARRLLRTVEDGTAMRWDELEPDNAAVVDAEPAPTFQLPYDSGRALLESLMRYYNGAEDTRQLRKDYEAERKRVDMLANSLVDIARASAERGFRP